MPPFGFPFFGGFGGGSTSANSAPTTQVTNAATTDANADDGKVMPFKPFVHPAAPDPSANDQSQLNQLENQGGGGPVAKSPDTLKLLNSQVAAPQRAVSFARSADQQAQFHKKALATWQGGIAKIDPDTLFGGPKSNVLSQKLANGSDVEKTQAGLWILGDQYGSMLGSFGTAGIDGRNGYFTAQALKQFKDDYQGGKFKDLGFTAKEGAISDEQAMKLVVEIANQKTSRKVLPMTVNDSTDGGTPLLNNPTPQKIGLNGYGLDRSTAVG